MTDIVKLNIGGSIFQTSKSTLTKFDGFFRTMFETGIPVTKDESDAIFIDRDPKHFRLILNFMRDGHVDLQKYSEDVEEIQKEAQYYLLEELDELCKMKQKPVELEYPDQFRFIKSDEELFKLTFMPKEPVLVMFGPILVGGDINYPGNVNLLELHEKYSPKIDIYIRLYASSGEFYQWYYKGYANGTLCFTKISYNDRMDMNELEESIQEMISPQRW